MPPIKNKLIGAFDLTFLFGRGIERFSGTRQEALQSLVPMLAVFPVSLVFSCFYPPKGMESGYGYGQIVLTLTLHFVLALIVANGLILGFSILLQRRDKFWLFFSASNWTALVFALVTCPLLPVALLRFVERDEMDRIFVIIDIYSYIITACIAWRAFNINWQLAGVAAIVTLFVNQELSHALYTLQGIPIPW